MLESRPAGRNGGRETEAGVDPALRAATVIEKLDRALRIIAGASLALVFLVILLQVAMRYLLQSVPFFMEEAARHVCAWGVFAGVASAIFHGTHIRVSILQDRLRKAGKPIGLVLEAACLCLYVLVAVSGLQLALFLHAEKSIAMGIPLSVPVAAIPVFFSAAAVLCVARMRTWGSGP